MTTTRYWCELAWLGGSQATPGVVIEVAGGRIVSVASGRATPPRRCHRVARAYPSGARQRA